MTSQNGYRDAKDGGSWSSAEALRPSQLDKVVANQRYMRLLPFFQLTKQPANGSATPSWVATGEIATVEDHGLHAHLWLSNDTAAATTNLGIGRNYNADDITTFAHGLTWSATDVTAAASLKVSTGIPAVVEGDAAAAAPGGVAYFGVSQAAGTTGWVSLRYDTGGSPLYSKHNRVASVSGEDVVAMASDNESRIVTLWSDAEAESIYADGRAEGAPLSSQPLGLSYGGGAFVANDGAGVVHVSREDGRWAAEALHTSTGALLAHDQVTGKWYAMNQAYTSADTQLVIDAARSPDGPWSPLVGVPRPSAGTGGFPAFLVHGDVLLMLGGDGGYGTILFVSDDFGQTWLSHHIDNGVGYTRMDIMGGRLVVQGPSTGVMTTPPLMGVL